MLFFAFLTQLRPSASSVPVFISSSCEHSVVVVAMAGRVPGRGSGLWTTAADVAEIPTAPPKPSINGAAVSRVMRQVMAHNKVVECEEMWAARKLQQQQEALAAARREDEEHAEEAGPELQLRAQSAVGMPCAADAPRREGAALAEGQMTCTVEKMEKDTASASASLCFVPRIGGCVTMKSLWEAREAAAQRKLRALVADSPASTSRPTLVGRDTDQDARVERKRHEKRERKAARAERRVARKEKKAAKKARLRRSHSSPVPASSSGET